MSIISLCLYEYYKSVFVWVLQVCVCMSIISLCLYEYYKSVFVWLL